MATELNQPGYLPFSKSGSEIVEYGLKLNAYTNGTPTHPEWRGYISGWTQLNGSEEVPEGSPTIAFTQKDSPRFGGSVDVFAWSGYNTFGALPANQLSFQIRVTECSNGHKFWLNQTITIVYTLNYYPGTEDVTFTYTLTEEDFKLTPTPMIPDPGSSYVYIYYGYEPASETYKYLIGGSYTGKLGNTITLSGDIITDPIIKSIEVTPHNFFQPPGG